MKLNELEEILGVAFPKRFHEIYESGAMKWLEMSRDELKNSRESYINDTKAFLMLDCSCEPYLFEEIPNAVKTLSEWIDCRQKDRNVVLSDNVSLVPFGHSGGGDMFCFLYSDDCSEPIIIEYYHDEYGDPEIIGHDLDEFIYVQMLDAADNEEDIDGDNFREHLSYLNEKYRELLNGKDTDQLSEDYNSLESHQADIWR